MAEHVALVADRIWQVQLPLPFPLKIVNAYLLADADGWTVVDAGLSYPAGQAAWQAAFAALGITRADIRRVVLTHAHPDHYGAAGWLTAESGAPVLCSPLEYAFAQAAWLNEASSEDGLTEFFGSHGLPAELGAVVQGDIRALRLMTLPAPERIELLAPDSVITLGGRRFVALHTPGHSDGHLALYCAAERLMLCGDTVLAKITPNIGLWSWGSRDPLREFLETLERLRAYDVALALPGHRAVITNFGERLAELRAHHEERLEATLLAVGAAADGFAVCQRLFPLADLTTHQVRFAMAEALAHLEYLVGVGRLAKMRRGDEWVFGRL